uniref:Secreted protein n=1 Tax=Rhipicephalus appendiculatus TaxID=34631 RepID=A0A131YDK8_RHIAP
MSLAFFSCCLHVVAPQCNCMGFTKREIYNSLHAALVVIQISWACGLKRCDCVYTCRSWRRPLLSCCTQMLTNGSMLSTSWYCRCIASAETLRFALLLQATHASTFSEPERPTEYTTASHKKEKPVWFILKLGHYCTAHRCASLFACDM